MSSTTNPIVANPNGNVTATTDPVTGRITQSGAGSTDLLYDAANFRQSDSGIDYVAWGLTLPTSGTIGVASIAAGVAYVSGYRVAHTGSVLALSASSDNYVDIGSDWTITVSAVANGEGAPAKAASSLRLGYVVTNASAVTSATITGKDSNGNWMGNYVATPHCRLNYSGAHGLGVGDTTILFGASTTTYDNNDLHSETLNTSRITIAKSGLYAINAIGILSSLTTAQTWMVKVFKNGSNIGIGSDSGQADKVNALRCTGLCECKAGDYLQLVINMASVVGSASAAVFSASKVS